MRQLRKLEEAAIHCLERADRDERRDDGEGAEGRDAADQSADAATTRRRMAT